MPPTEHDNLSNFTESFMKEGIEKGRGLQSLQSFNALMQRNSNNASVIFTALPPMPFKPTEAHSYLNDLDTLSSMSRLHLA